MQEIELTYDQYHNLVQSITDREQLNAIDLCVIISASCLVIAILLSAVIATYLTAGLVLFVFIPAVVVSFFAPTCAGSLTYSINSNKNKAKAMSRLDKDTKDKIGELPKSFNLLLSSKLNVTIIEPEKEYGSLLRPY